MAESKQKSASQLLRCENVARLYRVGKLTIQALKDVSFHVHPGETLGIVGESGSGKSTLMRLLLGLEQPDNGSIVFEDANIAEFSKQQLIEFRRKIGIVFQQPQLSFDPRWPVYKSIEEPLVIHHYGDKIARMHRVNELAEQVGLPANLLQQLPAQFSGGQLQRAAIARAIALKPKLILLDEPTSALDVSIQSQIINLLIELQDTEGLTYIFVTHDLTVIQHLANRLIIMREGNIVESGDAQAILANPGKAYTQDLFAATL